MEKPCVQMSTHCKLAVVWHIDRLCDAYEAMPVNDLTLDNFLHVGYRLLSERSPVVPYVRLLWLPFGAVCHKS